MSEQATSSPAAPTPPEKHKPSFGERLAAAFLNIVRFLVRLLLILVVLGLIAGAIYLAMPYVYKHYIQPLQDVRTQVDALQQESTARAEQVNQRLTSLQNEIAALQSQQKALTQQIDDQQAQWEALQERLDTLEQQNKTLSAHLDELEEQIEDHIATSQNDIAAVQATAEALQQAWEAWMPELKDTHRQMDLLRAMNSLLRTRLLIGQANYGLAAEELQQTQAILERLQKESPADADSLAQAAEQMQLASEALPAAPKAALQNVEAVWALLNSLFPAADEASAETTAEASLTPTPTPTPSP